MALPEYWTVFRALLVLAMALASTKASMDGFHETLVHHQCSFTSHPRQCFETLMELGSASDTETNDPHDHVSTLSALVNKIISETNLSNTSHLPKQMSSNLAQLAHPVADYCEELMSMSKRRLEQTLLALKDSPETNKADIQTWLSAAVTFQQSCKDSADGAASSTSTAVSGDNIMQLISQKMDYLSQISSYPLDIVNQIVRPENDSSARNRRLREEQKFPDWVSGRVRKLLQATTIRADAVVAKDGSGDYKTVSDAIDAASGNRFVIHVKAGTYEEKISFNKDGITLIGDGKYSTVIVGDDSVAAGASMPGSATFTIKGDGFIARDIGFQNTAGPKGQQALALYVASDHSVFYRCSISGNQDTLYALALRQFYRECDIYGTIDFIFGNAAAVFQSCNLVLRRPGNSGGYNAILANGRTSSGQNTGFAVQSCKIVPASDFSAVKHSYESYLGRPWKEYSRAVVMESSIDDAIVSKGWVQWPGAGGGVLKTLYFAEHMNSGPGYGTGGRVKWPGFHVIGEEEAGDFTVANFISGRSWLPETGVTFVAGL